MKKTYQAPALCAHAVQVALPLAQSLPLGGGGGGTIGTNPDGELQVDTKEEQTGVWDNEW